MKCSFAAVLGLFLLHLPLAAQEPPPAADPPVKPGLNLLDELELSGPLTPEASQDPEVEFRGEFQLLEGSQEGILRVTAVIQPTWHVYSLTQPEGGPTRSTLEVKPGDGFEVTGKFQADRSPAVKQYPEFPVPAEEHAGQVVWSAPLRLGEGVDPASVTIEVIYNGQACQDGGACVPYFGVPITARFAGTYTADAAPAQPDDGPQPTLDYAGNDKVEFSSRFELDEGKRQGKLWVKAEMAPHWHIYSLTQQDGGPMKSTLSLMPAGGVRLLGEFAPDRKPEVKSIEFFPVPVEEHAGEVQWSAPIELEAGVDPESLAVGVVYSGQVCEDEGGCIPLSDIVVVGRFAGYRPPAPAAEGFRIDKVELEDAEGKSPIFVAIGFALLGGFLLNFMPCVLPVIGLKILSFVQQAGEDRGQVFKLNVWYSAGLASVFLVLATLLVGFNLGWGELNQFPLYRISMACVVFVLALSFLGVWEIPIPGFASKGTATDLAEKEGPWGAFAKGVVTTLLAVPCSGPGIAFALAWCAGKPPALVYGVFLFMALGMALPYLIIGANPKLIRFLPKPGAWMETFKETMGFVLLATVIFFFTFIKWENLVPTLTLMFSLWAACWMIGRLSITSTPAQRTRTWITAICLAVLIGLFSFTWLKTTMTERFTAALDARAAELQVELAKGDAENESPYKLDWQPFTEEKLSQLTASGKTVLVDFTADWCLTCKTLEKAVLNTEKVKQLVERNGVVTLKADWSDRNPAMGRVLEAVAQTKQLPVIAIFPAQNPNRPLTCKGGYSQSELLGKLEQAGPSNDAPGGSAEPQVAARTDL